MKWLNLHEYKIIERLIIHEIKLNDALSILQRQMSSSIPCHRIIGCGMLNSTRPFEYIAQRLHLILVLRTDMVMHYPLRKVQVHVV